MRQGCISGTHKYVNRDPATKPRTIALIKPKENMDTLIIVTVAVLSYLYFWDFDEQG